jgi:hypothetical protein
VVFRLHAQVLEYRVRPEALHEILTSISIASLQPSDLAYPVVYLTMPDRVVDAIARARCCRKGLVADEEVQVLGTTLSGEMATGASTTRQERGLVRDSRAARARAAATACWAFGSYRRGEDEGGGVVAGETWRCIVTTDGAGIGCGCVYQASSSPCRYVPASVLNRIMGACRLLGAYLSMTTAGV